MFQQMGGCSIDFGEKYEAKVDVIVRNERMYIKVKNTGESDSYIRLAIFNVSNLVTISINCDCLSFFIFLILFSILFIQVSKII